MTVMAAHQPTKALASFAADLDPAALPPEVREKLGWLLLDYLRVCSIGARLPWSDWARKYIGLVGKEGASHVLFSASTLNAQHATFMNVTFGSSFDADDTHVGAMLHPGVAVWSAALATAEHVGQSGAQVLAAVVAGYETIIRIGLALQPGHFRRGFQSTGTCDVFGTAAAAARLIFRGRDASRRIQEAIGLAGSYPSGVAQFYYSGSSGKRIQAAHAAQSGVAAALLTQAGFSGPVDIIEGSGGFARAYADAWDPAIIESGLGERFHLMDMLMKSHAAAARVAAQSMACWPCASSTALPGTTSKPSAWASRGSSRAASPTRIPSTCKRRRCAFRSASRSPPKSRWRRISSPPSRLRTMRRRSPIAACLNSRTASRSISTTRSRRRAMSAPPPRG